MNQALKIQHNLADVIVKTGHNINWNRLQNMIHSTLDQYLREERIAAKTIHDAASKRHGVLYRTAGYHLRLYRQRANMTQIQLAEKTAMRQHHLSEMENNKRVIGKANAKKLATVLDCNYQKLL